MVRGQDAGVRLVRDVQPHADAEDAAAEDLIVQKGLEPGRDTSTRGQRGTTVTQKTKLTPQRM